MGLDSGCRMHMSLWLPALESLLGSGAHMMRCSDPVSHLGGTHSTACCTAPPPGCFCYLFVFFSAILNNSPGYFLIPASILCAYASPAVYAIVPRLQKRYRVTPVLAVGRQPPNQPAPHLWSGVCSPGSCLTLHNYLLLPRPLNRTCSQPSFGT